MKKSINAWCFQSHLSLEEIFKMATQSGFSAIELNMTEDKYNEGDIKDFGLADNNYLTISMGEKEYSEILELSKKYNIKISGISTGLHWTYPLSSNDEDKREKGKLIVRKMIECANFFKVDTILVVPGCTTKEVSYDVVYERAKEAMNELKSYAEEKNVIIGIENVWNKFLLSPLEAVQLLDEINSPYVKMYFDAGNVLQFGFPEQWVKILNKRIAKVHIKDFDTSIGNIRGFKNLLEGNMDYKALLTALREVGYDDYITAELSPYNTAPYQLIENTSKALEYIIKL
ncbi:MAG: sugar phosphate isomerase/epimerase family protein [Lachnospirales bacterium]